MLTHLRLVAETIAQARVQRDPDLWYLDREPNWQAEVDLAYAVLRALRTLNIDQETAAILDGERSAA